MTSVMQSVTSVMQSVTGSTLVHRARVGVQACAGVCSCDVTAPRVAVAEAEEETATSTRRYVIVIVSRILSNNPSRTSAVMQLIYYAKEPITRLYRYIYLKQ